MGQLYRDPISGFQADTRGMNGWKKRLAWPDGVVGQEQRPRHMVDKSFVASRACEDASPLPCPI
ncbi:MAG: hypothetical protein KDB87_04030, partial [Flavobacteriales bacterium]|nr:hypothetical protein [Flavobacteriales bacterium]